MSRRGWFIRFLCSSIEARSMTSRSKGVSGVDVLYMNGGTSNMQMGKIFKIRAGKIHEIETLGTSLPYGTQSG
jgi:hypothetical protein